MLTEEREVLGDKPVWLPLCPPQAPYTLAWDRTQASAVGGRRLTDFHPPPSAFVNEVIFKSFDSFMSL
jgi:hypothetical protein